MAQMIHVTFWRYLTGVLKWHFLCEGPRYLCLYNVYVKKASAKEEPWLYKSLNFHALCKCRYWWAICDFRASRRARLKDFDHPSAPAFICWVLQPLVCTQSPQGPKGIYICVRARVGAPLRVQSSSSLGRWWLSSSDLQPLVPILHCLFWHNCFSPTPPRPQGHMENEISELICVKNNQEKTPNVLPCGGEAVVLVPWAAPGRQAEGLKLVALQRNGAWHPTQRWWLILDGDLKVVLRVDSYTKQVNVVIAVCMGISRRYLRYLFL